MTDIEQKALALLNEVLAERVHWQMTGTRAENASLEALCRAIEQHEAFRKEVSDIVHDYVHGAGKKGTIDEWENLKNLIIPAPKPDPLVDVFCKGLWSEAGLSISTKEIRAALEARGLTITTVEKD